MPKRRRRVQQVKKIQSLQSLKNEEWPLHIRVEIDWIDAVSGSGVWGNSKDLDAEPAISKSIGYLGKKTRTCIQLFQSMSLTTGAVVDSITIPRSCVKRIRRF